MDILEFYTAQSEFTDPGRNISMFEGMPTDVDAICEVIKGICLDYDERWKYPIQNERWLETNNRYVDEFLDSIKVLNKRIPTVVEPRSEDERMMTSVSHVATMCVSMLRYVGIPARKRVGFVKEGEIYKTYEIVEYFENGEVKVADPNGKGLEFVPAAKAGIDVRAGKLDAKKFYNADSNGGEVIVYNILLDLAAVNKKELLSWDRYGWMVRPIADYSEKAWYKVAEVCDALINNDKNLDVLQAVYESEEGLTVPRIIFCDTPLVPPHKAVLRQLD